LAVAGVQAFLTAQAGKGAGANVEMTTVVVARKPLEFGNELTPDALEEKQWPSEALPQGAFTKIDEVVGSERRVALRSIAVGEPVIKDKVSGFGGRAALSQVIAQGYRAVAVRVTDVSGAGGFILPGDRVDVVSTIAPTNEKLDTISNILIENVRVLAIDQEADESTGGAIVAKAATVEVTPEDAQKIALASTIGTLSLSLRNTLAAADGAEPIKIKPTRYKDLGATVEEAAPAKTVVRRAAPAAAPYATMNVTRGDKSTVERVQRERSRGASIGTAASAASISVADRAAEVAELTSPN
jgi:pilus assembly protein CpaB